MESTIYYDQIFMGLALKEAEAAFHKAEVPIGAVIVNDNGDIISTGHNLMESLCDPTAHAELLAIRQAAREMQNWRLSGLTLYSTVEPCVMCLGAASVSRIKRIVFGCLDERFGGTAIYAQKLNNIIFTQGVMEARARELMQFFFQNLRAGN